ncbi:hypothetical protein HPB51_009467 [Rhipicephalus microplus]|uniref:Uncharacterized protein n=1 Tax=Rhipicephalus microplus TaxID=6941 RepID=A0A9J6DTD7_RHIMP|nr:hypothetical protein HPB51_009467 [Rhipicephalus microplus]
MHEFYPRDYSDHDSDVDESFPVYLLSRHWKEELALDKPENKAAKRAHRTLRPARRSSGLHVLNPNPKFNDTLETRVIDANLFLEVRLLYRPGGSQIIFTKKDKKVLTLQFKDYNAKKDADRYDQPEPDLALVIKYLTGYDKPEEQEVDRKVFKPEENHTYAIHIRQRGSSIKARLNDVDCATVRLNDNLKDAYFTTTEGVEVKATHQPSRLARPYKAKIEPPLDVGDRIVLFGMFKDEKKSAHKYVAKAFALLTNTTRLLTMSCFASLVLGALRKGRDRTLILAAGDFCINFVHCIFRDTITSHMPSHTGECLGTLAVFVPIAFPLAAAGKLLSLGETVVPWPDEVKYDKQTRLVIQRFKTQLVVYNDTKPIYSSRKVDREHLYGDFEVNRAFSVDGLWIERLKLP